MGKIKSTDLSTISDDELLYRQADAAHCVEVARAWAKEPYAKNAGLPVNCRTMYEAMAEVCSIALEWMRREESTDKEKESAAWQVIQLADACRSFVEAGDAIRAAQTAANAAATYFSFGVGAYAEELKRKAEERSQNNSRAGKKSAQTRAEIKASKRSEAKKLWEKYYKEKPTEAHTFVGKIANQMGIKSPSTVRGYLTESGIEWKKKRD